MSRGRAMVGVVVGGRRWVAHRLRLLRLRRAILVRRLLVLVLVLARRASGRRRMGHGRRARWGGGRRARRTWLRLKRDRSRRRGTDVLRPCGCGIRWGRRRKLLSTGSDCVDCVGGVTGTRAGHGVLAADTGSAGFAGT